jgi:hypothetical protein
VPLADRTHQKNTGVLFRFTLTTVAPGQTAGTLRFVSLLLHILPQGGRHRRNIFSEEVSGTNSNQIRKRVSQKPSRKSRAPTRKTAALQQAWIELAELNKYSKSMQTSSTHVFASQQIGPEQVQPVRREQPQSPLGNGPFEKSSESGHRFSNAAKRCDSGRL